MDDEELDSQVYIVLINDEEQYSLWPRQRTIPAGWRVVGPEGPKAVCLEYVNEVWTDMRPASLRRKMAGRDAPDGTPSN
jgi:MbtH protein